MTDYPYGIQLAVSALDENNVIRDGEVWIYETSDAAGVSPLALKDLSGLPLANPLRSNAFGNTRPFVTTSPQVKWKSGTFEGLFDSFVGMRDEAAASKLAAEASALSAATAATSAGAAASESLSAAVAAAQAAANLVGAPADVAIAAAVNGAGTATRTALNDTYTTGLKVSAAAYALPGSRKSGNIRVGTKSLTVANTGHNAFPGFAVLKDGGYIAVWRSAPQHDPTPVPGVIKARKFDANGTPRGAEYTILTDTLDLRDPMLTRLPDGRLVMQYFKHDGTAATIAGVWLAVSTDDGATFSQLSRVPFTWDSLAACAGRMLVAPNGDWLVAAYGRTSATFNHIRLMRSLDEGKTWTGEITVAEGQAESRNYVEPVIGTLPDGSTLMCLIRVSDSNGTNVNTYRTISTDNGHTWSAETSVITGVGGRPAWVRLTSGGLVIVSRSATAPYPMQARTSWDNGLTWTSGVQVGPTPVSQGAYAQPVEIAPGLVGVVYSIEAGINTTATVYFGYLADGVGPTPLGDTDSALSSLFKGAAEGGLVGGAPTLNQTMGWAVWSLPDNGADQIAMAFQIPADWTTFDVSIIWTNPGVTTGDVSFRHDMEQVSANGTLTSAAGVSATVTAGTQYIVKETIAATGVVKTGEYIRVKPSRIGSAGADTLVGPIGIIGVKLTRNT